MGQIQNAFLQGLGIVSQAVQMYRLTKPYVEGQEKKAAREAAEKATQEAQINYDYEKYKNKIIQGITEEQKAKWLKENEIYETATASARNRRRQNLGNTLTENLKAVQPGQDFSTYQGANGWTFEQGIREQHLMEQYYPKKADEEAAAAARSGLRASPYYLALQQAAEDSEAAQSRKKNMKNTAKGGTV